MKQVPYCPIDEPTRNWLHYRWAWLCQQFGTKGLKQRPVVLATPEFFPDAYSGKPDEVEKLVHRVAGYMELQPETLEIRYYEETRRTLGNEHYGTSGMYVQNEQGQYEIWLEVTNLHDPERMIATIAHELGHVLLLGQGRITSAEEDHEPLTDLITVFFGLGAFPANTAMHEHYWGDAHYSGWRIGRHGYLSMNMFGYAHALLAISREEERPAWLKKLRLDVRKACQHSMKYLAMNPVNFSKVVVADFPGKKNKEAEPSLADEDKEHVHESDGCLCILCGTLIKTSEIAIADEPSENNICSQCAEDSEPQPQTKEIDPGLLLGLAFRYGFWLMVGIFVLMLLWVIAGLN